MRPLEIERRLEEKVLIPGEKKENIKWSIREKCGDDWDDKEVSVGHIWVDQCGLISDS